MIDYGGIRLVVKRTLRLTGQQANGLTGQGRLHTAQSYDK
jgi:hypothetical protein